MAGELGIGRHHGVIEIMPGTLGLSVKENLTYFTRVYIRRHLECLVIFSASPIVDIGVAAGVKACHPSDVHLYVEFPKLRYRGETGAGDDYNCEEPGARIDGHN